MSTSLLCVRELCIALPGRDGPVVDGVSLELAAGECLALVGASGSGKSITSAALLGLLPRNAKLSGSLRLDGVEMVGADVASWRRLRGNGIAMVWQDAQASLHPFKCIGTQLVEVLKRMRPMSRDAARSRAVDLLAEVGIERPQDRLASHAHQLSGGQRQRVMIALALAAVPRLLIADEATSALDTTVQAQIVALLDRLRRERELALLFVSHDLNLVRGIADRVAVMDQGRIVEQAPVRTLFAAPTHAATRALLDCCHPSKSALSDPPVAAEPLLQLDHLDASFIESAGWWGRRARTALRGVGFELARGQTLALVGESGSGKSTLARCLLGLKRPDRGRLRIGEHHIDLAATSNWSVLRKRLQLVFQDPFASLNPLMRIHELIAEPLRLQHCTKKHIATRVAALLRGVGLDPTLGLRFPHALSGGQRQRVAIARALAADPQCLVLDEATSALDVIVEAQILVLLRDLQREHGLALLFITHDLALAASMADQVAVLWQGELVEIGTPAEVFARPQHAHTRALLAARPGTSALA